MRSRAPDLNAALGVSSRSLEIARKVERNCQGCESAPIISAGSFCFCAKRKLVWQSAVVAVSVSVRSE